MIWGFEKLKLKEQSMGFIVTESMTRGSVLEFNLLHLREKALDAACGFRARENAQKHFLESETDQLPPFIWDKNAV